MTILITGIEGFIGRHLAAALRASGHRVVGTSRRTTGGDVVPADFTRDIDPAIWIPRLAGIDIVINAVGILRESGEQTFESVHSLAPKALFDACAQAGVKRVIQISALGADHGKSGYFKSKHAADTHLASLPLDWTIVQPSLVYGDDGTSAKLFTMLASLPILGVPGRGDQRVQPIHIDDLVAAIVRTCLSGLAVKQKVALVGARQLAFADMLLTLRKSMGLGHALVLRIPMPLMRMGAAIMERFPGSLLDGETLSMLEAGNVADASATTQLIGHPPRDVGAFIEPNTRASTARLAQLEWLLSFLRYSIAIVWIWTAIVSLGLYPRAQSLDLLYRTGVPTELAPLMLYGAATLDLFFGFATLFMRRRWLWLSQIALILLYTIIITVKLPEYWLHPYAPILKNLPMLAALYLLYVFERPARDHLVT